jgi:hypothetical protein
MPKTPLSTQGLTRPYGLRLVCSSSRQIPMMHSPDQRLVVAMGALSRLPTGWILACSSGGSGPRKASRISPRPIGHQLHQKKNPLNEQPGVAGVEGVPRERTRLGHTRSMSFGSHSHGCSEANLPKEIVICQVEGRPVNE